MDAYFERLIVGAATIDELLSDDFETVAGEPHNTDLIERRLSAWRRASAGGDRSLFARRLGRDGWTVDRVTARFAGVRRKPSAAPPAWIGDAIWIAQALQTSANSRNESEPCAFERLLLPVAEQADRLLWQGIDARTTANFTPSARTGLRHGLLRQLSELSAPAIYERFAAARKTAAAHYDQFIAGMQAGGVLRLFEDKPVLLRLMATITRQWIDTSREFLLRLDADLPTIRRDILHSGTESRVAGIEGDLSDPHNNGRSVRVVAFEDGACIVYKPKDLRLDIAWRDLIERLNRAGAPLELKAVRALARDGYGWTEFIAHKTTDQPGCERFFRRAGAWLALFHCFAASDMHQENMIATGDHPVPIDLETLLQAPAEEHGVAAPEDQAFDAAADILAGSVMMVGLLPAYGRSPDNKVFAIGGMTADWNSKIKITWDNINSDTMRPAKTTVTNKANPNLPHVDGRYAKFSEHIESFIAGFADYAKFLLSQRSALFDGFAGTPVRRVIRPTRFYSMLLMRLRNYPTWDDGVTWSAQADFIARLADWDKDCDRLWPAQRAERAALLALNVPHFVSPSDGNAIRDAAGFSIQTKATPGLQRARARVAQLDEQEIAWQIEVIRENMGVATPATRAEKLPAPADMVAPGKEIFRAEADRIAAELAREAIRRGPAAAWIGLDWLGDAGQYQLVCLGPDLYNGNAGISLFLAAHAAVTGTKRSDELARAGVARLRKSLKSRTAARMARVIGIGGATGLGSIVYALTAMSKILHDDGLLADAQAAAALFTDELITADKQLDVIGGSAGAIVGLLRLYRDSQSAEVLKRAVKCGEHLLAHSRLGPEGRRSWVGQGLGDKPLNGMSHGAAGFTYALAALAAASGRGEFAQAAAECIAFEDASYDAGHKNWPDLRGTEPSWPCQWCHGAPGIGLARLATRKRAKMDPALLAADIRNAVDGVTRGWPGVVDTLCCGTLGSVEFLCEAAGALDRGDLAELAARQLAAVLQSAAATGDYRWNSGKRQFNVGLFRGLAGVGYTALRRIDPALPNVLIWE